MGTPLTTEYLDKRFDDFEEVIDKRFDDFGKVIDKRFADFGKVMDKRFDDFEQAIDKKFSLVVERLDFLEGKINDLEQKMNFRFSLVEAELEDIKKDLKAYAKRDKEDSDALSKDVIKLQKRVSTLEQQIKKLKAAQKQTAKA